MKKEKELNSKNRRESFEIDYDRNSKMARDRIRFNEVILEHFKIISEKLPSKGIDITDFSSVQYIGLANALLNYFGIREEAYLKYGINNEYGYIFDLISFFRESKLNADEFDEEIKWRQDYYRIESLLESSEPTPAIANWIKKQALYETEILEFKIRRRSKLRDLIIKFNLGEYFDRTR
ncbi:hypothetical protein [Leptospira levettii]|uniref:hypothetical protein n=1 Tax=Leptospira levettii TaxID=2023178 RepID=UPI00223E3152|nr:hypothetical protein [Leptospira levettii]MCW7472193.1 hypothetical protein [Leptospira levettii]